MLRNRKMEKFSLLLLLGLLPIFVSGVLVERSMKLSENYHVSWTADLDKKNITFQVVVRTKGYIGFGLSPQGGMSGADLVIGGVDDNGEAYFTDRFSAGQKEPEVDASQDWKLLEGGAKENETHTTLHFTRALDTCDEKDLPITSDTTKFIWSYGPTDTIEYHNTTGRGTKSVQLLDSIKTEVDTSTFTVWDITTMPTLPNEDTAYWCTVHKTPIYPDKHQIVGFRVKLDNPESLVHNHHVVLHRCNTNGNAEIIQRLEEQIGTNGSQCYEHASGRDGQAGKPRISSDLLNYCGTYMYVWAKGGEALFLPDDIGLPFTDGPGEEEYFIMEIHYDNPDLIQNLTYETGMEIYTTNKPRTHEAGMLTVGHQVNAATLVPPNVTNFGPIVGHCSPGCTTEKFPKDGVNVFNVLLHAHLAGQKVKLRHFRQEKELPWISYDDNYDFDYQQTRALLNNVKVLPGDQLTYECTYDSKYRNPPSTTIGGISTRHEMCETLILYYPRIPELDRCGSTYPVDKLLDKFGKELGVEQWSGTRGNPVVVKPDDLAGQTYTDLLDTKINWTSTYLTELQTLLHTGDHNVECYSRLGSNSTEPDAAEDEMINYPKNLQAYAPAKTCGNENEGGSAGSILPATLISLLVVSLAILHF